MPGLLAFHAHPDDEVISTGGTLSHYSNQGEQVVVVTATDGSEGEIHNYDESEHAEIKPRLAEIRAQEVEDALGILGPIQHDFLGYKDSGMMGTDANKHEESFWQADLMEAAGKMIRQIRRHRPEVMVIYDPFGGYGHPDHINVHRVGLAAYTGASDLGRFPLEEGEEIWEPSKLYWTVFTRTRLQHFAELRKSQGLLEEEEYQRMRVSGTPDQDVTCWMDVSSRVALKKNALKAHKSQVPDDWFMLALPDDQHEMVMGTEAFVRVLSRVEAPPHEVDLFHGLR